MQGLPRCARLSLLAIVALAAPAAARAAPPPPSVVAAIDLSQPFATRSGWRFTATQGPSVDDPLGLSGDKAPGEVDLCLRRDDSGPCDPQLQTALNGASDDVFARPHYLNKAEVAHGRAARPVLLVQTASLHSGDGDQLVFTQALVYLRGSERFVRAYGHATGANNNQEVRFIADGPLQGDIISVDPTGNAPFGFWVSVNALPSSASAYREVLRYRSATRYGDGNPLAVIDSEMPNIERRLGLWRPGSPLPLPAGACPAPHLIHAELWCR